MPAAFLGNFVEKDIHKASLIATICFSVGMAGTGYLSPVKALMLWFEDRKGLATGLAVAGIAGPQLAALVLYIVSLVVCMILVKPTDKAIEAKKAKAAK